MSRVLYRLYCLLDRICMYCGDAEIVILSSSERFQKVKGQGFARIFLRFVCGTCSEPSTIYFKVKLLKF